MAYGTIKVDTITFTNGGSDQSISVSGVVQSISGNITATGTIQGSTIIGTSTVSGATVTGDAGQFTTATITSGVFASGTAAAPSISVGTTDNGIYSPGADQVAISTNGAQALYINADGDILVADGNRMEIDEIRARDGAGLKLFDDAGAGIFIKDGGNVGLGTSSPSYELDIISTSGPTLSIGRDDSLLSDLDFIGGLRFGNNDNNGSPPHGTGIKVVADNTFGSAKMHFLSGSRSAWDDDTYALTIDSSGNVGVGATEPGNFNAVGNRLVIGSGSGNQGATIFSGSSSTSSLIFTDSVGGTKGQFFYRHSNDSFGLITNTNVSALNIDSSGRLLVGTSSVPTINGGNFRFTVSGSNFSTAGIAAVRYSNNASGAPLVLAKSRGTEASPVGVNDVDELGKIIFVGHDGTDLGTAGAQIQAVIDSTPNTNDMPVRLVFSTNGGAPDTSPTERMRIESRGITSLTSSAPTLTGSLGGLGGRVLSITNTETSDSVICATNAGSLNIQGGSSQPGAGIRVSGIGAAANAATIQFFATSATNDIASAERMRLNAAGELLIGYTSDNGAYKLQVNSQIFATSATIATSDGRYKENVATLDGCVDLVKALRPVSFDWKEQPDITRIDDQGNEVLVREGHNFPDGTQVGFIAQEVETVLADKPWLGSVIKQNVRPAVTDADGNELAPEEEFLGIAEGNLVAVLTSALKEAIGEIESLKARVAALEAN